MGFGNITAQTATQAHRHTNTANDGGFYTVTAIALG